MRIKRQVQSCGLPRFSGHATGETLARGHSPHGVFKKCCRLAQRALSEDLPELLVEVQNLAMGLLIERSIESMHAIIKAETRASHGILPGLVCSKLRASQTMRLLDDTHAWAYLCSKWNSRMCLQELLEGQLRRIPMSLPKVYEKATHVILFFPGPSSRE